jgi:hypothetical protein
MLIYLIGFSLSLGIAAIIQGWPKKSIGFAFWSFVVILIPCLIAGLRAAAIGTDTMSYAQPLYSLAVNNDTFNGFYNSMYWRAGWRWSGPSDFEVGYVVLVWLAAKLFQSFQMLLFLTEALSVVPIYIAISKRRSNYSLCLTLLMYYFLFFNQSLNMMRQYIAMAFVFLAVIGLYKDGAGLRGQFKPVLAICIGLLFHTSALLGFGILLLRLFLDGNQGKDTGLRKALVIVALSIGLLISVDAIRNVLPALGLSQYVVYLGSGSVRITPGALLQKAPMLILTILLVARKDRTDYDVFLFAMVMIGTVLSQLVSQNVQSGRIGLYFYIVVMCVPSALCMHWKRQSWQKILTVLVSAGYCLVYWFYVYAMEGSSETIPYLFFWS